MAFAIPAKVETLFGSQTRAKVLSYLAELSVPQTGYAISKSLAIGVSKVYPELKRLESSGILATSRDVRGAKRFLLNDEDLRRFLVRNARILPADDWFSAERTAERRKRFEEAKGIAVRLPPVPAGSRTRRLAREFRRPPGKDRALDRVRSLASRKP